MISQTILMRRVGIISVPTLLLAITIAWFENLDGIFNPPFFIAALNVSLVTAVSVIVAYLSAKSYLESGLSAVVLLGTGVLTYGVGLFLTGIAFTTNLTIGVSIAVVSCILAGALQLAGSSMTWKGIERYKGRRQLRLAASYGGAILILSLFLFMFETGILAAPFSIGDVLFQAVFGVAIILFATSALMIRAAYSRTKSPVLFWYSLALALIAVGIFGFDVANDVGDMTSWAGALANYMGCLLFLQSIRTSRSLPLPNT